jgi:SAM-dependent methyltransferase
MALPLHQAGIPMAGVDLSTPMMARIAAKAGTSRPPFPLAQADGTRLPIRDGAVGAAMVVHVLHLVRTWEDIVREMVRAVRPGGRILVNLGGAHGINREVTDKFREFAPAANRIGLTEPGPLDALMAELGAGPPRLLERVEIPENVAPVDCLRRFETNQYSGTWRLSDEERTRAVELTRRWVYERWADPEIERPDTFPIDFRVYDLAAA